MIPFELVIWNADEVAEYLRLSKPYFLRTTRYAPGFPPPITGDHQRPRWRAKAVAEWALKDAA